MGTAPFRESWGGSVVVRPTPPVGRGWGLAQDGVWSVLRVVRSARASQNENVGSLAQKKLGNSRWRQQSEVNPGAGPL